MPAAGRPGAVALAAIDRARRRRCAAQTPSASGRNFGLTAAAASCSAWSRAFTPAMTKRFLRCIATRWCRSAPVARQQRANGASARSKSSYSAAVTKRQSDQRAVSAFAPRSPRRQTLASVQCSWSPPRSISSASRRLRRGDERSRYRRSDAARAGSAAGSTIECETVLFLPASTKAG